MTREELIEVMARAICAGQGLDWKDQFSIWSSNGDPSAHEAFKHDAAAALAAIEAAGVRLVPVDEKPGHGWLHEAVKDASLRVSKNTGETPPQLLYAPILWAMQDALAASPYAPPGG